MAAREVTGMLLMALAGVGVAAMIILESVLKELGLPFFASMGATSLCVGLLLAAAMCWRGAWSKMDLRQYKWVWIRGLFGSTTYCLLLLSVRLGAPLGDASALQSTNVVVAALLGRVFLGERLRCLHVVALILSVIGAALITKPAVLLGLAPPPPGGTPWLGYLLALAAGTTSGATFIAARRSQGINPCVLTASVTIHEGALLLLLLFTGVVDDVPPAVLLEKPRAQVLTVLAGLSIAVLLGSCALSAGAQMCPAAAASTILTSVYMSLSFVAETVLHNSIPEALSVVGAILLLLGVFVMALARRTYMAANPHAKSAALSPPAQVVSNEVSFHVDDDGNAAELREELGDADETDSLASFIASEFSGLSLSSCHVHEQSVARQRRSAAGTLPAATVVGTLSV